jgi:hypothetical protein
MIDIMDELNLSSITRFSIAPFTEYDKELMQKISG